MEQMKHASAEPSMEEKIAEQEAVCRRAKENLDLAQAEALQRQFELTQLNNPGFFQRHFGSLRKKKEAAWAAYQEAVLALEQAKLDFAQETARLSSLQTNQ